MKIFMLKDDADRSAPLLGTLKKIEG